MKRRKVESGNNYIFSVCAIMLNVDPSLNFDFEMETTNPSEPLDTTPNENPQDASLYDDHGLVDAHDFNQL